MHAAAGSSGDGSISAEQIAVDFCEGLEIKEMAEQLKCLVRGNWQGIINLSPGFSQTTDVGATLRDEEVRFHMTTSN